MSTGGAAYVKASGVGNTGWAQLAQGTIVTTLNGLTDVNAPSPADAQVLSWSAGSNAWVAATVGAGGSGATQLNELSDVTITSSATGHVLIHNGSVYINRVLTTADIASGTFADARISSSSVVQHLPTVTLAGDASGSIDLSAATSLSVSVNDNSHNHIIGNVTGLQTALDAKAALAGATFTGAVVGTTIRAKPAHTSQSTAYTLTATDMNTTINTTGNVTIDGSIGTAGDIVIVYNNSASPISIVDGTDHHDAFGWYDHDRHTRIGSQRAGLYLLCQRYRGQCRWEWCDMSILASLMGVMSEAGGQDSTPDAINWANISGADVVSTTDETVSGIVGTIDLYYEINNSGSSPFIYYRIDSGTWQLLNAGSTNTFTVGNNQTVGWQVVAAFTGTVISTITVKNASDAGATLDTFSANVSYSL